MADELDIVASPPVEGDSEQLAGLFRGGNHLFAFGGGASDRLLDQDMLAGFEGGQGHGEVQVVGNSQADRLDVVAGEEVLVVAVDGRHGELSRKLLAPVGI
jgi:hypothetical protein